MDLLRKRLRLACYGLTLIFAICIGLPLFGEWISVFLGHRSVFCSFHLTDPEGRLHTGGFHNGNFSGFPAEGMLYGFETPKDMDLSPWDKTIVPMARYEDMKDGFTWSHNGVLWTALNNLDYSRSDDFFIQGRNLGFELGVHDQSVLLFPGAPIDTESPSLKFIGKFPTYQVTWEDEQYHFELTYNANVPRWYEYNDGKKFLHGDFGSAYMHELTNNVTGTVTHKKSGKVVNLSGRGLIEDAAGKMYSMYEFGGHDWRDIHFDNGWGGSLFITYDDWQWGMNNRPRMGWIYDPERQEYHTFHAVEPANKKLVYDEKNPPFHYVESMDWLAFSEGGTLRISETILSYIPILLDVKYIPIQGRIAYGRARFSGEFIRRDGSVVKLKNGIGSAEHFNKIIPDFQGTATWFLAVLILAWGFYWGVSNKAEKRSLVAPIVVTSTFLFFNMVLYFAWSY